MTLFIVALVPPLLWAIVNHIDKYLLSRVSQYSSVNILMVYSTTFSVILLPILYYFGRLSLFLDLNQIFVQIIGGLLLTTSIYFYLVALSKEEASIVIPFALLVPVFGYIFSYFFLGEVISTKQFIACMLIIIGALILTIDVSGEKYIKIKYQILFLMFFSAFFQAAQETLFKYVTIQNSFVASIFWLHVGILLFGVVLLLTKSGLIKEFGQSIKRNGFLIFSVNFGAETISALAYIVRDFALLLAPIAIVMTLNGYQPAFVFILGIIFTLIIPKFATEKIKPIHLLHKALAITIMVIGTIYISQTL